MCCISFTQQVSILLNEAGHSLETVRTGTSIPRGRYDPVYKNQFTADLQAGQRLQSLCILHCTVMSTSFIDLPMFLPDLKCSLQQCWRGFWISRSIIILKGELHFHKVIEPHRMAWPLDLGRDQENSTEVGDSRSQEAHSLPKSNGPL